METIECVSCLEQIEATEICCDENGEPLCKVCCNVHGRPQWEIDLCAKESRRIFGDDAE